MKWSISLTVMAILLAGTAAAKTTKRDATDSTKNDAVDLRSDVTRAHRFPIVFRNCEHPAASFCTDNGWPPATDERRRVRRRDWAW